MKENVLKSILLQGTQLVKKVAINEISIEKFLKQYNNFYYYNALDGHEGNDLTITLFKKYSDVIRLHKDIQTSVVDLIYLGAIDGLSKGGGAGKISAGEGKEKIEILARNHNINALLSKFDE